MSVKHSANILETSLTTGIGVRKCFATKFTATRDCRTGAATTRGPVLCVALVKSLHHLEHYK